MGDVRMVDIYMLEGKWNIVVDGNPIRAELTEGQVRLWLSTNMKPGDSVNWELPN